MDTSPYPAVAATCVEFAAHSEGAIRHDENLQHGWAAGAERADFAERLRKGNSEAAAVFPIIMVGA